MYEVYISKRVLKNIWHMSIPVQRKMVNLIDDLRDKGPIRLEWPNFSKLVSDHYHCHLTYKWVVCWTYRQQGNRIEVIVQAVVKTPRIEIAIRGEIPPKLLAILEEEFGDEMQLHADDDDEMVDVFETAWYTNLKKQITPGMNLKIYRDNYGLTQNQLGQMPGGFSRRHISHLEHDIRPIPSDLAQKLSRLFDVSIEKFTQ